MSRFTSKVITTATEMWFEPDSVGANDHVNPFASLTEDIHGLASTASSQFTYMTSSHPHPKPEHQTSLPLPNSDPTCSPPVTAGRQRTLILCFDGTGEYW